MAYQDAALVEDRRSLERMPTTLRGRVFPSESDCLITDYNERGAKLHFPQSLSPGDEIVVVLWSTGLGFEAMVRWTTPEDVGVRFIQRCDFRGRVPSRFMEIKALWLKSRPKVRRPERMLRSAMIVK